MRIAIMQPTYLPWIGYFDLMDQVDQFVLLDDVQFDKRSWQQRNRIKAPNGLTWLTVPVRVTGRYTQLIHEVELAEIDFWQKHAASIQAHYRKSPYFAEHMGALTILWSESPSTRLVEVNTKLINWFAERLGIGTQRILSSQLGVDGTRSARLAAICAAVGADEYLSPPGSATYVLEELSAFTEKGISVFFQRYSYPEHRQLFPPFVPYSSALDVLMNEGPASRAVMLNGRGQPYLPDEVPVPLAGELHE